MGSKTIQTALSPEFKITTGGKQILANALHRGVWSDPLCTKKLKTACFAQLPQQPMSRWWIMCVRILYVRRDGLLGPAPTSADVPMMKKGKRRQYIRIVVFTCIFLLKKAYVCDSDSCKASKPTLAIVPACPQNPKELQTAKDKKDCESLAKLQNCSKPEDFVYHCLLSTTKDKLYEVCAPAIYSPGYCIGYDSFSQDIQVLFTERCTSSSCSKTFFSADIFNYSFCQKMLRSVEKTGMSPPHTLDRRNEGTSSSGL
ncbi:uncharacterized protein LOC133186399 [Saccostrea echinata]|uniref:uncharacterized protein LOC133186399 n=1 Tax=Saccostrea echinata TaxID=191078 RepID=UPI002A81AD75|nr:uncharacterized protein LOC133186399 [Saccostrea echinata]